MPKQRFSPYKGYIKIEFLENGEVVSLLERKNVETLDSSIQMARLMKDNAEPNFGAYMLAVGSGATGANAADERYRKLNAELERKPFDSISFVDPITSLPVLYPTNVIDLTVTFLASEAVGLWNEMGVLSPVDANPLITNPNPNTFPTYDETLDITPYDVLLNYDTFGDQNKPNTQEARVTWRFVF